MREFSNQLPGGQVVSRIVFPDGRKVGGTIWRGRALKRATDVAAALSFLLLFSPLLISVILLLLFVQGRPLFIAHKRVGRDGRIFPCLKFRTMRTDADAVLDAHLESNPAAKLEWSASRKLKQDPRVTSLGHVLRTSSLDELPQLINVLKGDMSLVGPRPIVTDEMAFYGSRIQHYLTVRPGLTGAWQVSGRSDVSYASRVQIDVDYVTNWTLSNDILILLKTIPAVARSRGSY